MQEVTSRETRSVIPRVVVVGGGNAGLCAALAARENGADVVVLERAPEEARGGNSAFTGGLMRFPFQGVDEIVSLVPNLTDAELRDSDFGQYTEDQFFDDLATVTGYRADPDLAHLLVTEAYPTLTWMVGHGVKLMPSYGRQSYRVEGKMRFWGGAPLAVSGSGAGLVDQLLAAAGRLGVDVRYGARVTALHRRPGGITGVEVETAGFEHALVEADAVVLAAGGFEANAEWRTRYLGPGWDLAKVRGTRYNTGDGIAMALEVGAAPRGNWSGAHAVGWERNAPDFGDRTIGDGFNRHHYQFGIMVNADGHRFLDEGRDIRNYTYAEYGRRILEQRGQFAWQVFDARTSSLLGQDTYRLRQVTRVQADTLEGLAPKLDGVDAAEFLETVRGYNAAVRTDREFDPTVKDGRATTGLTPPKSNWALRLDTPPFEAFAVTCGITFTFGGVATDVDGRVLDVEERPIPGLYSCGEMVGGLFYGNYPGGTGLTWGSVLGRRAGVAAARQPAADVPAGR